MSKRTNQKQAARVVREQLARERRRQRTLWAALVAVAVLIVAGMFGFVWYAMQDSDEFAVPPGVAASDDSGIAIGNGPVTVDVYADYLCPACKQWEAATQSTVDQLIEEKKITLVFHPISILDRMTSTQYSTRSASASGCAAEGGKFSEFSAALFANQPPEGGAGLSDDELIRIGGEVGLVDPDFADCVRDGEYRSWVEHTTDTASDRGVTGTPTIFVNGTQLEERSVEGLKAAVEAAAP